MPGEALVKIVVNEEEGCGGEFLVLRGEKEVGRYQSLADAKSAFPQARFFPEVEDQYTSVFIGKAPLRGR